MHLTNGTTCQSLIVTSPLSSGRTAAAKRLGGCFQILARVLRDHPVVTKHGQHLLVRVVDVFDPLAHRPQRTFLPVAGYASQPGCTRRSITWAGLKAHPSTSRNNPRIFVTCASRSASISGSGLG